MTPLPSCTRRRRGFALRNLLILIVAIVLAISLAVIAASVYRRLKPPVKTSRLRSDQRSLATAIETYWVDHRAYPAMTMRRSEAMDAHLYPKEFGELIGRTLRGRHGTSLADLTTPVAYVTVVFGDPLSDNGKTTFRYFTDGVGWILGSYGPDKDEKTGGQLGWNIGDIDLPEWDREGPRPPDELFDEGVERVYDGSISQPSLRLLAGEGPRGAYTYDPTNGTISPGDVWRTKQ